MTETETGAGAGTEDEDEDGTRDLMIGAGRSVLGGIKTMVRKLTKKKIIGLMTPAIAAVEVVEKPGNRCRQAEAEAEAGLEALPLVCG